MYLFFDSESYLDRPKESHNQIIKVPVKKTLQSYSFLSHTYTHTHTHTHTHKHTHTDTHTHIHTHTEALLDIFVNFSQTYISHYGYENFKFMVFR